jgi:hypothetical protein
MDLGNIEIVLKIKGATKSEDRDLSFLVLTLKSGEYCSFHEDYTSKHSTLKLEFRHIYHAVEATISVRLIGGSSVPPCNFHGVFSASTSSIDNQEVVLLAFGEGKLPISDNGTIKLSRRVVSVGFHDGEELKVSIVYGCVMDEQVTARDDIVLTPKKCGRSCGVFNVSVYKMQVAVAWSCLDFY